MTNSHFETQSPPDLPSTPQAHLEAELADAKLLLEVTAEIISCDDAQEIYRKITQAAVAVMHSDGADLQLLCHTRGELQTVASFGLDPTAAEAWASAIAESNCTRGQAIRTQERAVAADVRRCEFMAGTAEQASALGLGLLAMQSTPLFLRSDRLLGMISTYWKRPHAPSTHHLLLLDILARQAAGIIERKQAEQALQASEVKYRTLFESMDEGYCVIEFFDGPHGPLSDYIHVEANPAYVLNAGIPDIVGQKVREMVPEEADGWVEIYRRVLITGEPIRFERELIATKRFLELSAYRIGPVERRQVAVLFKDVTGRKRAEHTLREADRRKNEFLAMLAHELRNPLAPIRNAVQILRMTEGLGESASNTTDMIDRQISQMVRLVDDLLDVSRLSRGKIELRKSWVNLATAIHHAVEAIRPQVESNDLELTLVLPATPISLNADHARLVQVIANLLNNACKFTDRGGRIQLSVEQHKNQAIIKVQDSGIGISRDRLQDVFEMFVQIDTSLERSTSGLGLGLTIVNNLVSLHGGTVDVQSEGLGSGSTFIVNLPITDRLPDEPSEELPSPSSSRTSRRILVVDDNRDSANSLALVLRLSGNETHTAYDGVEAIEQAAKVRPDVVLLDIGLPKLNGYEVCVQIRKQPWGKEILLVALTGWGQEEDRHRTKAAGFDVHMIKPVALDELVNYLHESSIDRSSTTGPATV